MIIDALRKKYEAEIVAAKANIDVYQKNSYSSKSRYQYPFEYINIYIYVDI